MRVLELFRDCSWTFRKKFLNSFSIVLELSYIGDIDVIGYFYDKVVAECPERSAYEERFACPGDVSNGEIEGWSLPVAAAYIKMDFRKNKKIAATFAGGGDNI